MTTFVDSASVGRQWEKAEVGWRTILEFGRASYSAAIGTFDEASGAWVEAAGRAKDAAEQFAIATWAKASTFLPPHLCRESVAFGAFGFVAGSLVGFCVGFSVRTSSESQPVPQRALMRAVVAGFNGLEVGKVPIPSELHRDEVLVQVKAVAVDPKEASAPHRKGSPWVVGREASGLVLDSRSPRFEPRDEVWLYGVGSMAEFVRVHDSLLSLKPKNLTFEEAATMPEALLRFSAIAKAHGLSKTTVRHKRVLVHLGGESLCEGVGLVAVQVLHSWSGRVSISTGEEVQKFNFKAVGAEAHLLIPPDIQDLRPALYFDIVVNAEGPSARRSLSWFLRQGSIYIETEKGDRGEGFWKSTIRWLGFGSKPDIGHLLTQWTGAVEGGVVLPVIARIFFLHQFDTAFRNAGNYVGKSVLVFK